MSLRIEDLPDDLEKLKRIAVYHADEADLLRKQLRLMYINAYGRRSERLGTPQDQILLFEEELQAESEQPEQRTTVPAHSRRKTGRRPIPSVLPRVSVVHDVPEADKQCACGAVKGCIGHETSEQLEYTPASMYVVEHVRPKYACDQCEGVEEPSKPTVAIAPVPPQIIPKSIAGPSLLAHVIITKFADAVPFYRQEKQFARIGVDIKRSTMSNWAIALAEACAPLLALLQTEVLAGPLVNCDETTLQVLREPGRKATTKSFLWVFVGGTTAKPAIVFVYSPTRHGKVAANFLQGFSGAVQTDGFDGYNFLDTLPEIDHHGCWGHARRKFMDVLKAAGRYRPLERPRGGVADEMIERMRVLYAVDASARERELSPEETVVLRQEKAKPEVLAIKARLDAVVDEVPPKSLLGKAIKYTLGQWPWLETYLENGHVGLDNNRAENAIRPFVVGRKNFLFAGSPAGAQASAALYSLVESAKANKLEPYRYLLHVFTHLPRARSADEIRSLLPQYVDRAALGQPP